MTVRFLSVILSIFFMAALSFAPNYSLAGGKKQEECVAACNAGNCELCQAAECKAWVEGNSGYQKCVKPAVIVNPNLAPCQAACAQGGESCSTCLNATCTAIPTIAKSSQYQACKAEAACQAACTTGGTAGCGTCLSSPCNTLNTITTSTAYNNCNIFLSCQTYCNAGSDQNCPQCLKGCSNISAVSAGYQACQASQALLDQCTNYCSTGSGGNCSSCLQTCSSLSSNSSISSGYQACEKEQALLTQCESACTTASGGNCEACLANCSSISSNPSISSEYQACKNYMAQEATCQAACTSGGTTGCQACTSPPCNTLSAITASSSYQACQAQAVQAAQVLKSCQTYCNAGSDQNCSQCLAGCSNISAVSAGYQACQGEQALLTQCESACTTASGGNCTACLNKCSSVSNNPSISSGYAACNTQVNTTLPSCTAACANNSNCQACLSGSCTTALGSEAATAQSTCIAFNACDAACTQADSDPLQCQSNCITNPSCTKLSQAQLGGLSSYNSCTKAAANYSTCSAACGSKQCGMCLSAACDIPAITNSSIPAVAAAYNNCVSENSCQQDCTGVTGYDACQQQCFGSSACKMQGITIANSASDQALYSWIQPCNQALTTYNNCLTACNPEALDCGTCVSSACEGILEIKSSAGYQSCSNCSSACASAPQTFSTSSSDTQWLSCGACVSACQAQSVTAGTSGAPAALSVCTPGNYWKACNEGCQAAASLAPTTDSTQIATACQNCMSSNACQMALNSSTPVTTFGGVQIDAQFTYLTYCQTASKTAAEWQACNQGCQGQTTTVGCTSCLTTGSAGTACATVGVTPSTLGNYQLQPAYTALKNCQSVLDASNSCTNACMGAPTSTSTPSNSSSWNNCAGCVSTCKAQGISASTPGAPAALGVCAESSNFFQACDAGCATAVQSNSTSQCTACVNQMPACLAVNIENASTLTSTTAPFTVPAANTNLGTCQNWLKKENNLELCDSGCNNAVTLTQCTACINNANCQAPGANITSIASLTATPVSSLQNFPNLKNCWDLFSGLSTCQTACASAPASSSVAASDTSWGNCEACTTACTKASITSTTPGIPTALQATLAACSSDNSASVCDSGCATANAAQSLSGCQNCIANNSACSAAGFTSANFQASTIPSTATNPLNNLKGCQNLMLESQLLDSCNAALNGQTTASECWKVLTTNASCTNPLLNLGASQNINTISAVLLKEIQSGSYLSLASCLNTVNAIYSCVAACDNAPTTATTPAASTSWNNCPTCLEGCSGVTPTTDGAPVALGICTSQNYWAQCNTGCATAASAPTTANCTACIGNPACSQASVTPANISGLTIDSTRASLIICQDTLNKPANWTECDTNCKGSTIAAACTACIGTPACNSVGVTLQSLANMAVQDNYPNVQGCQKALNLDSCQKACSLVPASAAPSPTDPNWLNCTECVQACSNVGITEFSLNAPAGLSVCTQDNYLEACNTVCAAAATAATATPIDPTAASQCTTCLATPVCGLAGITASNVQNGTTPSKINWTAIPNVSTCQATLQSSAACQTSCNGAGTSYNSCQTGCFSNTTCGAVGINSSNIINLATNTYTWLNNCAVAYNTGLICSQACNAAGTTATPSSTIALACLNQCFNSQACMNIGLTIQNANTYAAINGASNCQAQVTAQQTTCANYCQTGDCTNCLSSACVGFISSSNQNYANCRAAYKQCAVLLAETPNYTNDEVISNILSLCTVSNGTATLNATFTGCQAACALPSTPTYAWATACVSACADVEKTAPSFLAGTASLQSQQGLGSANQTIAPYYQAAVLIANSCQAANTTSLSGGSASAITTTINACTACYNGIIKIPGMTDAAITTTNSFTPSACNGIMATAANCTANCNNAASGNPALASGTGGLGLTSMQMCTNCPSPYSSSANGALACLTSLQTINPNVTTINLSSMGFPSNMCTSSGSLNSSYQGCVNACANFWGNMSVSNASACTQACNGAVNSTLLAGSASLNGGQTTNIIYNTANAISNVDSPSNIGGCTSGYNTLMNIPGMSSTTAMSLLTDCSSGMIATPSNCYAACSQPSVSAYTSQIPGTGYTYQDMCESCPGDPNYQMAMNCYSIILQSPVIYNPSFQQCQNIVQSCNNYANAFSDSVSDFNTIYQRCLITVQDSPEYGG